MNGLKPSWRKVGIGETILKGDKTWYHFDDKESFDPDNCGFTSIVDQSVKVDYRSYGIYWRLDSREDITDRRLDEEL